VCAVTALHALPVINAGFGKQAHDIAHMMSHQRCSSNRSCSRTSPTTFAGTPTTMAWSGTSRVATAPPKHRALPDGHAAHNDGAATNRGAPFYQCRRHFPICLGLQFATTCRFGIPVVDEYHTMPNKDVILKGHPSQMNVWEDSLHGSPFTAFF
jgi:hypothetical protein